MPIVLKRGNDVNTPIFVSMYSKIKLANKYMHYWFTAHNGKGHGMHSPFVFDFITQVLNDKRHFYAYDTIEAARKRLLSDDRRIVIDDFGAGSRIFQSNERLVRGIAQSSLKPKKYSQLLFRMVQYFQSGTIIELGTSLGITTAYLASGNAQAQVITLEGAATVANIAQENFGQLQINNIQQVLGNFDDTLPKVLAQLQQPVDMVFVDGNHRYAPTIAYFEQLLHHVHEYSVIVLDDIHWSSEMEQAWHEVQNHPQVSLTIDLFFIGLVFFRKEHKEKQHFTVRY